MKPLGKLRRLWGRAGGDVFLTGGVLLHIITLFSKYIAIRTRQIAAAP